jgi:hypothetical protein
MRHMSISSWRSYLIGQKKTKDLHFFGIAHYGAGIVIKIEPLPKLLPVWALAHRKTVGPRWT